MPCWEIVSRPPVLEDDEVHVWRAALDRSPSQIQSLCQVLSSDEMASGSCIRLPNHKAHFLAAHGLLRIILGHYTGRQPAELQFLRGPQGKPFLRPQTGRDDVRFNMSHSGGLALYALTRGREIGIDVEQINPDFKVEEIVKHTLSPRELVTINRLPPQAKRDMFFRHWTLKEAFLKGTGLGLSLAPDQIAVSLTDDGVELETLEAPGQSSGWSLHVLDPGPGFAAALAVEGQGQRLRCCQWPPKGG